MVQNFALKREFTISQKFFIEYFLELLHNETLDSYRARLHNPYTILEELAKVVNDRHHNRIKTDVTVQYVAEEARDAIRDESELTFRAVPKAYLLSLIEKCVKKDADYMGLSFALQRVISENANYTPTLFARISEQILALNQNSALLLADYGVLYRLTNCIVTALINQGYSKDYLFRFASNNFGVRFRHNFEQAFERLCNLSAKTPTTFRVVFRWQHTLPLQIPPQYLLTEEQYNDFQPINNRTAEFLARYRVRNIEYICLAESALDYFAALKQATSRLSGILDQIYLGFDAPSINLHDQALVIGETNPDKTRAYPIRGSVEGHYRSGQDIYSDFVDKLKQITEHQTISPETKRKVASAVRYLRLGIEAFDWEQKFLSFWIGLEYIFSEYDNSASTIVRLKENLINSHAIVYVKRNLKELDEDIQRLDLTNAIQAHNIDLSYLKDSDSYDQIITAATNSHPLLAYRAHKFKERLFSQKDGKKKYLYYHKDNLNRHLTRIYRVRNEIVHQAGTQQPNINILVGNLRYYLTFMLNGLISFLLNNPVDANMDGQISIEDFFILQQLQLNVVEHGGYQLDKLFDIDNPMEVFY